MPLTEARKSKNKTPTDIHTLTDIPLGYSLVDDHAAVFRMPALTSYTFERDRHEGMMGEGGGDEVTKLT